MASEITRGQRPRLLDQHGDDFLAGGQGQLDLLAHPVVGLVEAADAVGRLQRQPLRPDENENHRGPFDLGPQRVGEGGPGLDLPLIEKHLAALEDARELTVERARHLLRIVLAIVDEGTR